MPKNRKIVKADNGAIKRSKVPSKLRVGTRSGGHSATTMSSAALVAVLKDTSKRKYHKNASAVLRKRNVDPS